MSDTDLPAHDYLGDEDEDEQPMVPQDENRPTADDPATSEDIGTAQTVTNDAVAGEPVRGGVAEDDVGAGLIEPLFAENDLADEDIDLDDTVEWSQTNAALEDVDAGDLDTAMDLDGPLSDYDALTDDQLSGTEADPERTDITEHQGPDLNADDSTDDGAGFR
jgi:hypothetical protein